MKQKATTTLRRGMISGFDADKYSDNLSLGTSLEVFHCREWVFTRLEMKDTWYLRDFLECNIDGLIVRI